MQVELTKQQESLIENEVVRRLKRDRGVEGGIKAVREKVPFMW